MDLWFTEEFKASVRFSMRTKRTLFEEQTPFQLLSVIETDFFGRVMLLDNKIMLTEKDEHIYHEMISHVPMAVCPDIANVLIIGGGDGGTARELLRYKQIKAVTLVDIDARVSDVAREYFPALAPVFNDPRLDTVYEDGAQFIAGNSDTYDLIIIDSTDPVGPGEGLFTRGFYASCKAHLRPGACLVNQSESPQWDSELFVSIYEKICDQFAHVHPYQAFIPTYPSGHWTFMFASDSCSPLTGLPDYELPFPTRFYNRETHRAAFALPVFLRELLHKRDTDAAS
jgi:spermidine synthase